MRIDANSFMPTTTVPAGNSEIIAGQGTAFADRLEKAIQNSGRAKTADAAKTSAEDAKLRTACRDMEAVFLNLMLTQMRETVPKGNLLGNSREEQMLTSMLDTELTKNMAQAGGMGLADMLYRQLSKTTIQGQAKK
ncbi:rod-binding protein [Sporomusa acidovorans]|uniref:Flagellar protein FlgJ N-terminal domain-containing protein n=1 Tax=Sporomusa acidovorans (strain ATCC 49682 / DSM 3132 / Mol) TaxID=1123286 RepID=A0ABZ3J7X5_SPOA4|nr:rod-binding protein [Sporomusa acidovorans]OZC19272.1 peptidoglycan hydrolase FlgJ [Sporomusa acidovorans DSM 3132]SDD82436.1 Rod binding protein [Sporomusa acidovorans]